MIQSQQAIRQRALQEFGQSNSTPDEQTSANIADLDFIAKQTDIFSKQQDITERKAYADIFTSIVMCWLVFIGIIVIGVGTERMRLSENIVISLIGTTTINLIGLLYVIANYLFPKSNSASSTS